MEFNKLNVQIAKNMPYIYKINRTKGFTLIELLVVIAIIGLLAAIVLVSLNTARKKSRDARTVGDLHQISTAMEMYYDSAAPSSYYSTGATTNAAAVPIPGGAAIGTFMGKVPQGNGTEIYYWYNPAATQRYCVFASSAVTNSLVFYASEKGTGTSTRQNTCP